MVDAGKTEPRKGKGGGDVVAVLGCDLRLCMLPVVEWINVHGTVMRGSVSCMCDECMTCVNDI